MEEDINPTDTGREDRQETRTDLSPSGSGEQTTGSTTIGTKVATSTTTAATTTSSATATTIETTGTAPTRGRQCLREAPVCGSEPQHHRQSPSRPTEVQHQTTETRSNIRTSLHHSGNMAANSRRPG